MFKKILMMAFLTPVFLVITAQYLSALTLEEAMVSLQIEALKAQMDELLSQNAFEKARLILKEMVELDEKIRQLKGDKADVYISITDLNDEKTNENQKDKTPRSGSLNTPTTDVFEKYEKAIISVCKKLQFDPGVIWTLLAIESNFSEDPVVVQKRTKCLGPWQHQPEHYIRYRKPNGVPYNPFDIYDACEVTVRILKANLASTGTLEKSIRMYASGSRYLETPYEQLPKAVRDYLDKFTRLYPEAKARFEKYGIYATSLRQS